MRRIVFFVLAVAVLASAAADNTIYMSGRVKDAVMRRDLTSAFVVLFDSLGAPCDTLQANRGFAYRNGEIDTLSFFGFEVPRVDTTLVFDVFAEGYRRQTVSYRLDNIGRRETSRDIPTIFMERAPVQLDEVVVSTTKIKFYNKGDTVVYNADAFQLAEGSMLDALIAQMPGVELNNNGQIKVNGQFVESLLLNGREFFDGNNNLMLENIAAYTVKNVQVYEGETTQARLSGDNSATKVLTMDVRLKKEYNMGWLMNATAGYGTADRYLGKLFLSWFNADIRITAIANVNNLNDNRQPGRSDTWTPEMMPDGKKEYRMAGIDYNYENADETRYASGRALFSQTVNRNVRTADRINFLPGGDTYDYSFTGLRDRETAVNTSHFVNFRTADKKWGFDTGLATRYTYARNAESALAGTFGAEQPGMTADILEAIYSDGSSAALEAIINRSVRYADGKRRSLYLSATPGVTYSIPRSDDRLWLDLGVRYEREKEELWRDYTVNFGADATAAERRRQYFDNDPNHTLTLSASARYSTSLGGNWCSLEYSYEFSDQVKDSYMYALDRLADMGVYGTLPEGYGAVYDPANSYTSRLLQGQHTLRPYINYSHEFRNKSWLSVSLSPQLAFTHRHFDYRRDGHDHRLSRNAATVTINSIWAGMIGYHMGPKEEDGRTRFKNDIRYSYRVTPRLPDMLDMLDVTDDTDPLNIYIGNPGLRTENAHSHLVRWQWNSMSRPLYNILYLGFTHTSAALVRGYTYDTATGIRTNRMYNVGGTRRYAVTDELSWQFGSRKQFSLSSETDFSVSRNTDMVGIDSDAPSLRRVDNRNISEKLKLTWTVGGQTLGVRCDWLNRHATSAQPGFNTLDANHVTYGLTGTFKLPAGFGASTDFMCYTRRGYGSPELDTTDPVWNMRVSYCPPRASRWVFMVDAFDILHKLSNVSYAVTATGRSIAYTNALPRYVLFSVQYRLSIQPKK